MLFQGALNAALNNKKFKEVEITDMQNKIVLKPVVIFGSEVRIYYTLRKKSKLIEI